MPPTLWERVEGFTFDVMDFYAHLFLVVVGGLFAVAPLVGLGFLVAWLVNR